MTAQRHPAPEPMFPMAPDKPGDDQEVQLKRRTLRLIQTDNRALRAALEDTRRKLEAMTQASHDLARRAVEAEDRYLVAARNQSELLAHVGTLHQKIQRLSRLNEVTNALIEPKMFRCALTYSENNRLIERLRDWLVGHWCHRRAEPSKLSCD